MAAPDRCVVMRKRIRETDRAVGACAGSQRGVHVALAPSPMPAQIAALYADLRSGRRGFTPDLEGAELVWRRLAALVGMLPRLGDAPTAGWPAPVCDDSPRHNCLGHAASRPSP